MKKINYVLIFIVVGIAVSCNNLHNDRSLAIDGSSTVFPVTAAIAEEYREVKPRLHVTIGVSGTGGGFQEFISGQIDIANASRPIAPKEAAEAKKNKIEYIELEVAYDGIVVVVNPENDWADSITMAQLKTLWEPEAQDKITRWNQIDSTWPNEEIHLFGPGVASGTFDYFTETVVGESGSSRGDYTASENDNVLVQGVSTDKYGLGFFGLAYYEENSEKLKLIGVDAGTGAVIPNRDNIKNRNYILARPLYIYVSSKAVTNPKVVDFVRYYLTHVDQVVRDVGYIGLSQDKYQHQLNRFNAFVEESQTKAASKHSSNKGVNN